MSEWNDAIRAALAMIDRLGADRPKEQPRREFDRHDRAHNTISAMHTRARTIRRGVETLLRPDDGLPLGNGNE